MGHRKIFLGLLRNGNVYYYIHLKSKIQWMAEMLSTFVLFIKGDSVHIAEIFYSIQGEGPSVGRPSIFLRTSGCNLNCVWCDTIEIMGMKNTKEMRTCEVSDVIQEYLVNNSSSILVITGGEPLIHESDISEVLKEILSRNVTIPWIEIESNATIFPNDIIRNYVNQFNLSPKISSAKPGSNAYKQEVIEQYVDLALHTDKKVCFKFVVDNEEDVKEVSTTYFKIIPRELIWLMPKGSTKEQLSITYPRVAEYCKDFGLNFSPRLHIDIWNNCTGV